MPNILNLENIKHLEDKLWSILEHYSSKSPPNLVLKDTISSLCEEWWEISQYEVTLQNMSSLFKDSLYKSCLKTSYICEVASITIAYTVNIHDQEPPLIVLTLLK